MPVADRAGVCAPIAEASDSRTPWPCPDGDRDRHGSGRAGSASRIVAGTEVRAGCVGRSELERIAPDLLGERTRAFLEPGVISASVPDADGSGRSTSVRPWVRRAERAEQSGSCGLGDGRQAAGSCPATTPS